MSDLLARPGIAVLAEQQNEEDCSSWVAPRPNVLEIAGIDESWSDKGFSVSRQRPTQQSTLTRLENPLSSDSALFLRAWFRQFPTKAQQQITRDSREQFIARLSEVL